MILDRIHERMFVTDCSRPPRFRPVHQQMVLAGVLRESKALDDEIANGTQAEPERKK